MGKEAGLFLDTGDDQVAHSSFKLAQNCPNKLSQLHEDLEQYIQERN